MSRALKSLGIFAAFVVIYTLSRHAIDSNTTTTTTTTSTTTTTTTIAKVVGSTCAGGDFSAVYNEGEGAAGTIDASVTLTKVTSGSCTLEGWPILALQDTTGAVLTSTTVDVRPSDAPIQFPVAQANAAPTLLNLTKGSVADFSLAYSDVPVGNGSCPSARTLSVQVAAGGSVATLTPTYPLQPCNKGTIWVSPYYGAG
ncbi:MAG: DUF4232 domain-containing protein [Acidimicrobiales bacterium]